MISPDEVCPHGWIDITPINSAGTELMCTECGSGMCLPTPCTPLSVSRDDYLETLFDVVPGGGFTD